jgi:hypothetical protein
VTFPKSAARQAPAALASLVLLMIAPPRSAGAVGLLGVAPAVGAGAEVAPAAGPLPADAPPRTEPPPPAPASGDADVSPAPPPAPPPTPPPAPPPASLPPAPEASPAPTSDLPVDPAAAPAEPGPAIEPSPGEVAPAPAPPAGAEVIAAEVPAVRRPRFEMEVGMGASFDATGLADARTVLIPAFEVLGGVGQGRLGFEARLFSSEAAGRFHDKSTATGALDMAIDRVAVDLALAWRPFAAPGSGGHVRYLRRVLRTLTLDLGGASERASFGSQTLYRWGVVLGAHVDAPLTAPGERSELRIRLSACRMFGSGGRVGAESVSDTDVETFLGLAVVF